MSGVNKKLDKLLKKLNSVMRKQKELAQTEEIILDAVASEENAEEAIEKEIKAVEKTTMLQRVVTQRVQKHQFLFPLIVATGVVLVWRGLWGLFDETPVISYYAVSLLVGLFLLWLFNRLKSL